MHTKRNGKHESRRTTLDLAVTQPNSPADHAAQSTRSVDIQPLLDDRDLEQITGRARSTWQKSRLTGEGPPFIRSGRLVRYRASEVEAWLARTRLLDQPRRPRELMPEKHRARGPCDKGLTGRTKYAWNKTALSLTNSRRCHKQL